MSCVIERLTAHTARTCNADEVQEATKGVHEGLAQSIGSFKDAPDLQLTHSRLLVI